MTARATAALVLTALGITAALAVTTAPADPPTNPGPATVWRTITETRVIHRRVDGHTVGWWRHKAIANRREANARRITLRRIRRFVHARWQPTARYGLELAHAVYGIDQTRRAMCESHLSPFASNTSGASGLLQFLPSTWRTTPFASFSVWDPVASALAGGWMVKAGRSGEWSCHL